MADIQTAEQEVIRRLHLDSTTVGTNASSDVKREIIKSMKFYDTETPWFLQEVVNMQLQSGQKEYELDPYFGGIISPVIFYPDSTDTTVSWEVDVYTLSYLKTKGDYGDHLFAGNTITEGQVRRVAISPAEGTLWVAPTPDSNTQSLEFTMLRSSQIPTYSYNGSAWTFLDPDGVTTLSSTFKNVWLDNAYDLIVNHTAWKLLSTIYGGTEASALLARDALAQTEVEIKLLRDKHTLRSGALVIPKRL